MPKREHVTAKPESAKQENVAHSAEEEALLQSFRLIRRHQRIDQLIQIAVHDGVDLIKRQADAVIRHPALREIIGADPLGTVAAAHLTAALRVIGALPFFPFRLI